MHILVIEDSPQTRELLKHSLERAGHRVSLAARAASGLKLALSGSFEAIVLDLMLPDRSGLDLCRDLRAEGIATPILFLTAKGEVEERVAGLDAGADDYLRKPFALAELHARLRALGRRNRIVAAAQLEWPGVRIDFSSRRLECEGREMALTAREWSVLELLAARAGHVVPREEVLEIVWHDTSAASSDSLDVILSRLRRKLGITGEKGAIRTLRGQGYVLEIPR